MSRMFVVFDLDGTLALTDHRAHFLKTEPKDWRGFYGACDGDAPCMPLIGLVRSLMVLGHRVEIWSGRSDEVIQKTRTWLCENGLAAINCRFRAEADHCPDTVLKKRWIDAIGRPDLVFEDRTSMVNMYRDEGIVCCQVAPAEF